MLKISIGQNSSLPEQLLASTLSFSPFKAFSGIGCSSLQFKPRHFPVPGRPREWLIPILLTAHIWSWLHLPLRLCYICISPLDKQWHFVQEKTKSQWLVIMHKAELVTVLEGAGDVAHLLVSCGSIKTGPSGGTEQSPGDPRDVLQHDLCQHPLPTSGLAHMCKAVFCSIFPFLMLS